MQTPDPTNIRPVFDAQGVTGPLRLFSEDQAARYVQCLEAFEAECGSTEHLHMKAHLYFSWAWELTRTPALIDAITQLAGPDVLVLASRFWIKEPGDQRFVSWHQDTAYFGLEPDEYYNMWISLTDTSVQAGCMRFYLGSHTQGIRDHEITHAPDNLLTRGQTIHGIDDAKGVPLPLKPGECSIHHGHILHWSPPNQSANRRIGFGLSFIPVHVRSTIGRRSATLLCGEDAYWHWDIDPHPTCDRDPVIYELMQKETRRYVPEQKLNS